MIRQDPPECEHVLPPRDCLVLLVEHNVLHVRDDPQRVLALLASNLPDRQCHARCGEQDCANPGDPGGKLPVHSRGEGWRFRGPRLDHRHPPITLANVVGGVLGGRGPSRSQLAMSPGSSVPMCGAPAAVHAAARVGESHVTCAAIPFLSKYPP